MSFKKCYAQRIKGNNHLIHLWTDENGYEKFEWKYPAYIECNKSEASFRGINGEYLKKTYNWHREDHGLHFHDMPPYQRFLIEKYGTDDEPSKTHREFFFDIEIEMGGALTEEYIESTPKPVTSIAWWDKQVNEWGILIIDKKNQLKHIKNKNKEIIPCNSEQELLLKFLERFREIDPDIIVGYNSEYFDIPYLYYRTMNVLGYEFAKYFSPIGITKHKKDNQWWFKPQQYVEIAGVTSLDYMLMHKKYSWEDEPSWKLDALGEKYAGINKIEYEGNLNQLFETDLAKFIKYNFRDVEILKALDEKLEYLSLTKNLSHKGKHNYSEVYTNTRTQDGAISAYLLSQGIIPPARDLNAPTKKDYAGGYLFCPKAGIYNYMFDEDLTSLYPSIIMSLNIGKETMIGRIIDANDRNNRLGLNDLLNRDPNDEILIENTSYRTTTLTVKELTKYIIDNKWTVSANGVFFRTDKKSALSIILSKWFDERVYYKGEMKKAYKSGNSELGAAFHMKQYTMKILLNSLYGALATKFRYGNVILAEATTLSGQRIIQESALTANRAINKRMKG